MRFQGVNIIGLTHVDAPHRISTEEIDQTMAATYARLGMPARLLENLTGVRARRFWEPGTNPSDGATLAGRRLLEQTGVDPGRIGVLVNTSVCRDWVEPSVACFVHHNLGLPETCLNFDIGNACLGFLDGMCVVGNMIERGQIDYGLVVDGESSRHVLEQTLARLSHESCDDATLKLQLATLTVGSGAAAMLLGSDRVATTGHRFLGSVSLAQTQHNQLCRGQVDFGLTDTRGLMTQGVAIAARTWARAQETFGWSSDNVDLFALHQVSEMHTQGLARTIGFSLDRAPLIYPEFGNMGPASVPIVLSKAVEAEKVSSGDRIVLAGIGSGINCTAGAVVW